MFRYLKQKNQKTKKKKNKKKTNKQTKKNDIVTGLVTVLYKMTSYLCVYFVLAKKALF